MFYKLQNYEVIRYSLSSSIFIFPIFEGSSYNPDLSPNILTPYLDMALSTGIVNFTSEAHILNNNVPCNIN